MEIKLQSESIQELLIALGEVQATVKHAVLNKTVVISNSKRKYADLQSVGEAAAEALTNAKMAITHARTILNGEEVFISTLYHTPTSQFIRTISKLIPEKTNSYQSIGSALTYYRRYNILCLLNMWTGEEDDDGETIEALHKAQKKEEEKRLQEEERVRKEQEEEIKRKEEEELRQQLKLQLIEMLDNNPSFMIEFAQKKCSLDQLETASSNWIKGCIDHFKKKSSS